MKRITKIGLIVIGILLLIIILISLLISPIAKSYIEKNSNDLVGRTVAMEKFRVNIFTGSLRIAGFDMKEQNGQESFVLFDELSVKMKLFDLLRHKVTVQKIHLSGLHLSVWQEGANFNFNDILKKFESTDTTQVEESSRAWEIGLYDILLREGNIFYSDLSVGSKWDMKNLNLKIPGIYFSGKETDIGLNLLFADGGSLATSLQYDIETSAFNLQLDLEDFSISGVLPYLQQSMRIETLSGMLDAHINIKGNAQHIMNSVVQGTVALNSFSIYDDRQEPVLTAESLSVDVAEISLAESKYVLNEFSVQNLYTQYVMEKDSSSNFTYLMKSSNLQSDTLTVVEEQDTTSTAMHLFIGKVDLQGICVGFKDNTLQQPFVYELKDISIKANDFNPDITNKIDIAGKLGATGTADIYWSGNFSDLSNLNLKVNLTGVDMKEFTPYVMDYFAHPITGGVMTFTSQNTVSNNMLKGANKLDIFKFNVGKSDKNIKPVVKIPMRLAVYVLKDRDDKIKMDLPIEGDISSPKFSYKKIITQTLVNLLVKVALSPFDFLANSMGFNADQLDEIEFANLQEDFTSEQYERFNQLSAVALAKPELLLEITQDINYTQTVKEQVIFNLKRDYYFDEHPKKATDSLGILIKEEITKIKDTDAKLLRYADSRFDTLVEGDIYAKALILYQSQVNEQIGTLSEKRNQLFADYLVTRMQVPATNIRVETLPFEPNKVYNNKSAFKISISLLEEEPEVLETKENEPVDLLLID